MTNPEDPPTIDPNEAHDRAQSERLRKFETASRVLDEQAKAAGRGATAPQPDGADTKHGPRCDEGACYQTDVPRGIKRAWSIASGLLEPVDVATDSEHVHGPDVFDNPLVAAAALWREVFTDVQEAHEAWHQAKDGAEAAIREVRDRVSVGVRRAAYAEARGRERMVFVLFSFGLAVLEEMNRGRDAAKLRTMIERWHAERGGRGRERVVLGG